MKCHRMRNLIALASMTFAAFSFPAFSQEENLPVEIIVSGKQPGPPMWRVKNGDNTLWIFAWLSPIPKNIFWESDKVEAVIADAQEYITQPDVDLSIPKLVMFNPINIFRGVRLGNRIALNEDKASLEEVLPQALYTRFSVLKSQYFPRNKKLEKYRPLVAGGQMVREIQKETGLVPAEDVDKKIRRLVKRNKDITVTEIKVEMQLEGGFKDLAARIETMMASISRELELSCFERQLSQMEEDLDEMQYRANTWAQGYIQEFRFIPLPGDEEDDCTKLIAFSSEQETYEEVSGTLRAMWLDAAETALIKNKNTFAVLDFSQLLLDDGLLAQLRERGYQVIEP